MLRRGRISGGSFDTSLKSGNRKHGDRCKRREERRVFRKGRRGIKRKPLGGYHGRAEILTRLDPLKRQDSRTKIRRQESAKRHPGCEPGRMRKSNEKGGSIVQDREEESVMHETIGGWFEKKMTQRNPMCWSRQGRTLRKSIQVKDRCYPKQVKRRCNCIAYRRFVVEHNGK